MSHPGLGEILGQLHALGAQMEQDKPLVDLAGVLPMAEHHQCVVFLRLPYPGVLQEHENVAERVVKFLGSINRPSTMKADVYTICGSNIMPGYQPQIEGVGKDGQPLFNTDWVIENVPASPYTLQITVDVVHPNVLSKVQQVIEGLK